MSVADLLELAGALAMIVGASWAVALLAPAPFGWPAGLVVFGVLVVVVAWLNERNGAGGGEA